MVFFSARSNGCGCFNRRFFSHAACRGNREFEKFGVRENAALIVACHVFHNARNLEGLVGFGFDFLLERRGFLKVVEIHFEVGIEMSDVFPVFGFAHQLKLRRCVDFYCSWNRTNGICLVRND